MRWVIKPWQELERDELYAIMRARAEVFVVEQDCAYQDADGSDPAAVHLWATDDTTPVLAYARLFAPGAEGVAEARIGRVITTAPGRGRGLGRELMRRALTEIATRWAAPPVWIGAQKYLERFYGELGFVRCGDDYVEDGIDHLPMLRATD
ncbi:MAG: GNAT family N-acetyltransferase [Deltaproteobacteria bacterium]|nr:GNAT family N-acetyltransferase [Deltaproteobacteria bacterium]